MEKLTITHHEEIHEVVYIEYYNDIPFDVITAYEYNGRLIPTHWDFFLDGGAENNLAAYESRSGGNISELEAPQFVDGSGVKIWKDDRIQFKGVPNCEIIDMPIQLENLSVKSCNPFDIAEIVYDSKYCTRCEASHSEGICYQHMYEDDEDEYNLKYVDDDSLVE